MKQELKKLASSLSLLILTITMLPIKALVVMLLANLFNLEFISQFSFLQILGGIIIFNLLNSKGNIREFKEEKEDSDRWKELGLKLAQLVLVIALSYMFLHIFN